jgi:hypothetical protein
VSSNGHPKASILALMVVENQGLNQPHPALVAETIAAILEVTCQLE